MPSPVRAGVVSDKLVASWRARAMAYGVRSDLAANQPPVRLTLVSALAWSRTSEITGRVGGSADRPGLQDQHAGGAEGGEGVVRRGKEGPSQDREVVLDRRGVAAQAGRHGPEGGVPGGRGEATLRALVAEAKTDERAYRARVRTVLTSSYSSYYRRMLPKLLAAIEFKCNNIAHRPVMDALDLLGRYADVPNTVRHYDAAGEVPVKGVVPDGWLEAVVDSGGVIERVSYELCVLVSLKNALRRREIYVAGATRWRNPEEDLPTDFEDNRDVHYGNLRQPLDAGEFIAILKELMRASMAECAEAISKNRSGGTRVKTHRGEPRWHVPDLGKLKMPENLRALHAEVAARWGIIDLLDFLKESDFVTDLHRRVHHGRHQGGDTAGGDPQTPAAGLVRARHERRDQAGRRRRQARRDRGRAARHPPPVRQPRQPARGDRDPGQRHLADAGPAVVGQRHRVRVGFEEVRLLVVEPDDRVPRPLRRPRRHDLLARGAEGGVHLLAADRARVRGGRDDRGRAAALHRRHHRSPLRRHPRPERWSGSRSPIC